MQYKYSFKLPQRMISALEVCNTGIQRCERAYQWGPGVRDHYIFHYVIGGRGSFQTPDGVFELRSGDLFLVSPEVNLLYRADTDAPWEYCWVGFRGTEAKLMLDQTGLGAQSPVLRGADSAIYEQMLHIYRVHGSLPYQSAEMTGALYQLFAALMRAYKPSAERRMNSSVQLACDYIANNYASPISVEEVAGQVGLSRSRLCRLFREKLELSPIEYLTQYRIRQACALLARGDLSIRAVAVSVGYENQMYFARRFKEIMGVTPSQYARQIN